MGVSGTMWPMTNLHTDLGLTPQRSAEPGSVPVRVRRVRTANLDLEKGFLLVVTGAIGLVLACLPFAMVLDFRIDRQRPMYADVQTMAELQYRHIQVHGRGVPAVLRDGQSVTLADTDFAPSAGVVLSVEMTDGGYCIRARNQYGDHTAVRCEDGETDPRLP